MTHRPFIGVVIAFGLGVFISLILTVNVKMAALAAGLFLLISSLCFQNYRLSILLLCLSFVGIGALYTAAYRTLWNNDLITTGRYYSRSEVRVQGVVISDITEKQFFRGKKSTFELQVQTINFADNFRESRKVRGRVLVNIFREVDIAYGDQIMIEGKLHRPFNFGDRGGRDQKFSYRDYLERKGIVWMLSVKKTGRVEATAHHQGNFLKDLAMRSRHRLKNILDENLSANESALMDALLLGNRTQIPKPLQELFLHTGTAHILAISGMNIAVVATFILLILKFLPIPRSAQFVLTILLLAFYMILTGAPPSVIRASIMAIVLFSGFLLERDADIFNSLAFAAFLLLLMNPMNLLDVGCQLSFISVLAIIILYPVICERLTAMTLFSKPLPRFLCQAIGISLAAWVGVAGLIAYYFQIVTPITILANLLIIFLMEVIVFLGMGLLLTGFVLPVLNFMFAACIKVAINLMILIVYVMDRIPGAYFNLPPISLTQVVIYYLFLSLLFWLRKWIFPLNTYGLPIDKPRQL